MIPTEIVFHWNELIALVLCVGLFGVALGMFAAAEAEDDHTSGPPGVHPC